MRPPMLHSRIGTDRDQSACLIVRVAPYVDGADYLTAQDVRIGLMRTAPQPAKEHDLFHRIVLCRHGEPVLLREDETGDETYYLGVLHRPQNAARQVELLLREDWNRIVATARKN